MYEPDTNLLQFLHFNFNWPVVGFAGGSNIGGDIVNEY